jgi:hypothetical protein
MRWVCGKPSAWFNAWLRAVIRRLALLKPPRVLDFDDPVMSSTPADDVDLIFEAALRSSDSQTGSRTRQRLLSRLADDGPRACGSQLASAERILDDFIVAFFFRLTD